MDENIYENEQNNVEEQDNKYSEFDEVVRKEMTNIHTRGMMLGVQVTCKMVLDKISAAMMQPGKRSMNDYKRLVKEIEQFCRTGLSRKINADGTTTPVEESEDETVQN